MSPSFAPNNPAQQPNISIDEDYMGSLDQYVKQTPSDITPRTLNTYLQLISGGPSFGLELPSDKGSAFKKRYSSNAKQAQIYADSSILYSHIDKAQENKAMGAAKVTSPANGEHRLSVNANFIGKPRSILNPKNHYVEFYTKPETYIKFIPSTHKKDDKVQNPEDPEAPSSSTDVPFFPMNTLNSEVLGSPKLGFHHNELSKKGVIPINGLKEERAHLWDPAVQPRATHTHINNPFFKY